MTPQKAHRINGLEYREVEPQVWAAIGDDGSVVATRKHRKPSEALRLLVEDVYARNRLVAMERDGYRCVECGSFSNLSAHHKVHRGIGGANRDDRVANLSTSCLACHEKHHGVKVVGWRAA